MAGNKFAPEYEPHRWKGSPDPEVMYEQVLEFYRKNFPLLVDFPNLDFMQFIQIMSLLEGRIASGEKSVDAPTIEVLSFHLGLSFNQAAAFYGGLSENFNGLLYRANCYQYARNDFSRTPILGQNSPMPGRSVISDWLDIRQGTRKAYKEALIRGCEADGMEFLGKRRPTVTQEGRYLIGMFIGEVLGGGWDMDFTRQDRKGKGSRKPGVLSPQRVNNLEQPIVDGYRFEGYLSYVLPEPNPAP